MFLFRRPSVQNESPVAEPVDGLIEVSNNIKQTLVKLDQRLRAYHDVTSTIPKAEQLNDMSKLVDAIKYELLTHVKPVSQASSPGSAEQRMANNMLFKYTADVSDYESRIATLHTNLNGLQQLHSQQWTNFMPPTNSQRQQPSQQQVVTVDSVVALSYIEQRHREVVELERSMKEVNEIFRDLATLVNEQASVIDNIECNISNAVQYSSNGLEEIRKANAHQRKWRKYMTLGL